MAKDDYSIDWTSGEPGLAVDDFDSQPMSAKDISTLDGYAALALKTVGKVAKENVGYDALTVKLLLPYCGNCRSTAGRYPKSLAFKMFATWGVYMIFIFTVLLPLTARPFFARLRGPMLLVFTLAVVAIFYWMRRPTAPQTSIYQPVRLAGFGGNAEKIRKLSFRFSNAKYAGSFSKLNRKLVGKGLLSVG